MSRELAIRLLYRSPVTLFRRPELLAGVAGELSAAGYHVVQSDAGTWLSVPGMHRELSRILHFPGYYGENLDAFNDCMRDVRAHEYGFPAGAAGLVVVFTAFDEFAREFPRDAHIVLDILADHSRVALLTGEHVLCLLQVNDPGFGLPPVGAVPLMWNNKEWRTADRGREPPELWSPETPRPDETDAQFPPHR